ncbi:hypothetical protein E2562_035627 [Oryza meyeriana var. granulata]|uniref:F-box domain-containing protein n=1 Tax=Oryza meyeriana var. granulata TaxID=110450 RepID=A0A6G1CAT3_9ORYZ|nr:hypothetical protein E2562_035627 [Oryza meyeriana var. granulata]
MVGSFFLSRETSFPPPLARLTPSTAAGDDPDQIGRLPNCLLTTILSLLPLNAAARTVALSRHWRSLWLSTPLHLVDSDLPFPSPFHSDAISCILASHRGDTVSFHLSLSRPSPADLDSWLRILARRRLQELLVQQPSEPLPLPPSLLSCRSLRPANLTNCHLPIAAAGAASFPHLHELTLRYAFASSLTFHGLLAGCPALASLSLDHVFSCRSLRVHSRTLRSLMVSVSLRQREEVGEEL